MKASWVIGALALVSAAQSSQAGIMEFMPSYASISHHADPTDPVPADGKWHPDRYAPAVFATNPGPYQGRTDVLEISIDMTSPSGDAGTDTGDPLLGTTKGTVFNALQGREYGFIHTGSWTLSADLFVESTWASASNGLRRAELWGVSRNALGVGAGLPAIGFTNEGTGTGRFRYATGNWEEAWFDLPATVNYGAWNSLRLEFDPTADLFKYYVNGAFATSFTSIVPDPGFGVNLGGQSTGLMSTIMETYNYTANSLIPIEEEGYSVRWSNTAVVPEPGSAALLALALGGLAVLRRKRSD